MHPLSNVVNKQDQPQKCQSNTVRLLSERQVNGFDSEAPSADDRTKKPHANSNQAIHPWERQPEAMNVNTALSE